MQGILRSHFIQICLPHKGTERIQRVGILRGIEEDPVIGIPLIQFRIAGIQQQSIDGCNASRAVIRLCRIVKTETERIDSRFLEPACGDGNFLAEILSRKLAVVKKKYKKFPMDYEKYSVLAVSSLYGVDILQDNCEACRERLYRMWDKEYKAVCKKEVSEDCRRSVRFILSRNIVCGNALSLMCVDENQQDTGEPIVFSEWAFVTGYQLQRSDYTFARLMQGDDETRDLFGKKKRKKREEQMTLFDADEPAEKPSDEGEFLKKYVTHYRRVWENEQ